MRAARVIRCQPDYHLHKNEKPQDLETCLLRHHIVSIISSSHSSKSAFVPYHFLNRFHLSLSSIIMTGYRLCCWCPLWHEMGLKTISLHALQCQQQFWLPFLWYFSIDLTMIVICECNKGCMLSEGTTSSYDWSYALGTQKSIYYCLGPSHKIGVRIIISLIWKSVYIHTYVWHCLAIMTYVHSTHWQFFFPNLQHFTVQRLQ